MTEEENERQKGRLRNSRKDEERGPQGEERSKQKSRNVQQRVASTKGDRETAQTKDQGSRQKEVGAGRR